MTEYGPRVLLLLSALILQIHRNVRKIPSQVLHILKAGESTAFCFILKINPNVTHIEVVEAIWLTWLSLTK